VKGVFETELRAWAELGLAVYTPDSTEEIATRHGHVTGALQQLFFPRIYLAGVDVILSRYLVNGLVPFECFDRHLGFQF
jgi:hypothetical protein